MARQSQGAWWINQNYPPAMICDPSLMTVDTQYNINFNDLFSCVLRVIQFDGLPETVDQTFFKMCLYLSGRVAVFRDTRGDNALRALDCASGGEPDIYYMPSKIIITNPAFRGYSYNLKPGEDVAVVFCREVDRYNYGLQTGGLFGLISTTAQLLADNTISINVATKNMRLVNILSADDDNTVKSINETMAAVYSGAPYQTVQKTLIDKLESIPLIDQPNTQQLLQLLQTRQYIYAHFYEQIGLKTHDQMKKERLITSEIDEGAELAVFNLQDMLQEVQRGIDEVNRIFDTKIQMRLHPLILQTLELADADEDQTDGEPAEETAAAQASAAAEPEQEEPEQEEPEQEEPEQEEPEQEEPEQEEPEQEEPEQEEPEQEQEEPEPEPEQADEKTEADVHDVSIDISGDVAGDVTVIIDNDTPEPEPEPEPEQEQDKAGGDEDADISG